jgi:hypothetical protein
MKTPQISRRHVLGGIAAGALGSIALPGFAQSGAFPTKPIKIIMPWAAGGGGDVAKSLGGLANSVQSLVVLMLVDGRRGGPRPRCGRAGRSNTGEPPRPVEQRCDGGGRVPVTLNREYRCAPR